MRLNITLAFLILVGLSSCKDKFGTCTTYYDGGEKVRSKVPCNLRTREKNGIMRVYKKNGDLWKTVVYVDNQVEDTTKFYYSRTGELLKIVPMLHDKRNGVAIEYFKNGKVKKEEPYKDNLKEGHHRVFKENGNLLSEIYYSKGEKEKGAIYYYENVDLVKEKITYTQDIRNGAYEKYDEKGKLMLKGSFKNGLPVGSWTFKTILGNLKEADIAEITYAYREDIKLLDKYLDENLGLRQ